jgi:hypothetical protein
VLPRRRAPDTVQKVLIYKPVFIHLKSWATPDVETLNRESRPMLEPLRVSEGP